MMNTPNDSRKTCVVIVPEAQWREKTSPKTPLGQWLVENLGGISELELPERKKPEREIPFQ
jgi:hypothetical protein